MIVKCRAIKVDWCTVAATGTLHCKREKFHVFTTWGEALLLNEEVVAWSAVGGAKDAKFVFN